MKKDFFAFILTLLSSICSIALCAQDRALKIPLTKGELAKVAYAVDGAGILIVNDASSEEAKEKGQKGRYSGVKIHRISSTGEKLWDVVSGQQPYHGLLLDYALMGKIIYSSKLEYVYYAYGGQDDINFLQIDALGKTKSLKVENLIKYDFAHALFCTAKKLGFIVRRSPLGKSENTYTLHTWNNDDLVKSEVVLPLPKPTKESKYDNWSYLGNTEESIVFVSRYDSNKDDKVGVKVIKMGFDGQIQANFDLDFNLNKDLLRFFFPYARTTPAAAFFETKMDGNTYVALQFDAKNNAIYAWGLGYWQEGKKFREGFYLNKYDLNGQLEWTTQEEIPEEFSKNGLTNSAFTNYAVTALQINYNQSPVLHIKVIGSIHTLEFYVHGDIKGNFSIQRVGFIDLGDTVFSFVGRDESPGFLFMRKKFIEEEKNKDYTRGSFQFHSFSDGELIAEFPKNQDHFNVYWFKR